MINRIIFLVSFSFVFSTAFSQKNCYESHKRCVSDSKQGFILSGQSKSGTFIPGDTAEVTLTLYKNMEYRLSFCSPQNPNVDGKVEFQIVEYITESVFEEVITYEEVFPEEEYSEEAEYDEYGDYSEDSYEEPEPIKVPVVTKRKVYKKVPVVTFDNTTASAGGEGQYTQEYRTIANNFKTITIRVYIPGTPEEKNETSAGKTVSFVCVGLLLEHKAAPKLGFK